jgi:hypothetical protein
MEITSAWTWEQFGIANYELLKRAQLAMREDIENSVKLTWRDKGLNIVCLGRIERIETHAFNALFSMFKA